jgi:hypothetical protein
LIRICRHVSLSFFLDLFALSSMIFQDPHLSVKYQRRDPLDLFHKAPKRSHRADMEKRQSDGRRRWQDRRHAHNRTTPLICQLGPRDILSASALPIETGGPTNLKTHTPCPC